MSFLSFLSSADGPICFYFDLRLRAFDARREAGGKFVDSREGVRIRCINQRSKSQITVQESRYAQR